MRNARGLFAAVWAGLVFIAAGALAQTTPVTGGINWLASHQNANGTWGAVPELVPRDTARALIALSLHRSTGIGCNRLALGTLEIQAVSLAIVWGDRGRARFIRDRLKTEYADIQRVHDQRKQVDESYFINKPA